MNFYCGLLHGGYLFVGEVTQVGQALRGPRSYLDAHVCAGEARDASCFLGYAQHEVGMAFAGSFAEQ